MWIQKRDRFSCFVAREHCALPCLQTFQLSAACHQQISFDGGMLVLPASSEPHAGLSSELALHALRESVLPLCSGLGDTALSLIVCCLSSRLLSFSSSIQQG